MSCIQRIKGFRFPKSPGGLYQLLVEHRSLHVYYDTVDQQQGYDRMEALPLSPEQKPEGTLLARKIVATTSRQRHSTNQIQRSSGKNEYSMATDNNNYYSAEYCTTEQQKYFRCATIDTSNENLIAATWLSWNSPWLDTFFSRWGPVSITLQLQKHAPKVKHSIPRYLVLLQYGYGALPLRRFLPML